MYRKYSAKMSKLRVVLFLGSARDGRNGLRVAKFVQKHLEKNNYEVDLFDPLVLKFPVLEQALHFYQDKSKAPKWMLDAEEKVKQADAYVVVSGEYNATIPPALSNMLDHFAPSLYAYKPTGIVTYSLSRLGGARAAMHLRNILSELGTPSIGYVFSISEVHTALDENGKPLNDHMESGVTKLIKDLSWYTNALKSHKDNFGIPK